MCLTIQLNSVISLFIFIKLAFLFFTDRIKQGECYKHLVAGNKAGISEKGAKEWELI